MILKDKYYIRILAVIFSIVNIIFYILYIIYKCCCLTNIFRIDCIYSKKFDKILIGLVKYNQKEYINTFEYQKDNISNFILEEEDYKKSYFNLKVVFKNNKSQQKFAL